MSSLQISNLEALLALANDQGLVLSRLADGRVVVCRRELPGSEPLTAKTRNLVSFLVLQGTKGRTLVKPFLDDAVGTAESARE